MPVEIREIVLQARVVDQPADPVHQEEHDRRDAERLKSEILSACRQMIRDEVARRSAR